MIDKKGTMVLPPWPQEAVLIEDSIGQGDEPSGQQQIGVSFPPVVARTKRQRFGTARTVGVSSGEDGLVVLGE